MHTYSDEEIKMLAHQAQQIDAEIAHLRRQIDNTNPNL